MDPVFDLWRDALQIGPPRTATRRRTGRVPGYPRCSWVRVDCPGLMPAAAPAGRMKQFLTMLRPDAGGPADRRRALTGSGLPGGVAVAVGEDAEEVPGVRAPAFSAGSRG